MKFKSEFANAVKLFILLILFFWSCTWNSYPNLDLSPSKPLRVEAPKSLKDTKSAKNDDSVRKQHSDRIETFKAARQISRTPSKTESTVGGILPPFNEWKETEKMKYEKHSPKNVSINHHKKIGQRKLNYASEKCGAKILASNPEAKHRIAILNEKPDEYMLNPCKVKMWFVIELCDTVEATQVELANYELYSSSPREFSVFWSEVYPTQVWHLLGTFEAKDRRTMQTFHLNSKNLGKFIKVILYSHHGKEHFCLLSVIRVLGYSVVEKLEDIEDEESNTLPASDNQSGTQYDKNVTMEKEQNYKKNIKKAFFMHVSGFSAKICSLYFQNCQKEDKELVESCPDKLICRFFAKVLHKHLTICDHYLFSKANKTPFKTPNTTKAEKESEVKNLTKNIFPLKMKTTHENDKKVTVSDPDDIFQNNWFGNTSNQRINRSLSNEDDSREEISKTVNRNPKVKEIISNTFNRQENNGMVQDASKVHTNNIAEEKCTCKKGKSTEKISSNKDLNAIKESVKDITALETDTDSASLFHKESVFFKLNTRIKASEIDLEFINKYLQQLSQSYRQQMEDMRTMFNQTIKAIDAASKKAALIDEKQQENINTLQKKIASLTRKVDYLMSGQRDMLRKVFEIHAFFLILEIIIISTIFTIFMNVFHQKSTLMQQQFLDKKEIKGV